MKWYRQLHWQIIIAMILGVLYGIIASYSGWLGFTVRWIKPWGTIFINLLRLIAIPMILVSLITGVASLNDLKKMSRIGGKTIAIYIVTTVIAIIIGLFLVNTLKPGKVLPSEMREQLEITYSTNIEDASRLAQEQQKSGPLQPLVDMVPQNLLGAASNNTNMLQMVFVALLIGVGLVKSDREKTLSLHNLFKSANELVLRIVELIMIIAPIGVFAQLAAVVNEFAGENPAQALSIIKSLGYYVFIVLLGLSIQTGGVYCLLIKMFTRIRVGEFIKALRPAQVIGFSTSSSAATLPVTMEVCEKNLGISEEITGFTLPVGATINMDGTSLYQAVSVVFIAQILGMDLTFMDQIMIILTATLASIGVAGVPGAGIVMLVIVLQSVNVPIEGIVLIMGVERIIDMFRTVTNVTGDAAVTAVIAHLEDKILPVSD
jgi:proton glutamate symport protein